MYVIKIFSFNLKYSSDIEFSYILKEKNVIFALKEINLEDLRRFKE